MLKSTTARLVATIALITVIGYVLPMLGLNFAVDHGLYVAAGIVGASALRRDGLDFFQLLNRLVDLDPLESEVLDHSGRMINEIRGAAVDAGQLPEMWRALPLWTESDVARIRHSLVAERDELLDHKAADDAGANEGPTCACGHGSDVHGRLSGCWSVREASGRKCTCNKHNPAHDARESGAASDDEATITNLASADVTARLHLTLDRIAGHGRPSEYELTFDGNGDPTIAADEIPALIDALTELYRQWRDLAAEEGTL